jgi:hypothetical protein
LACQQIGRTRLGAGSRPRRGRFRPPDRHPRTIPSAILTDPTDRLTAISRTLQASPDGSLQGSPDPSPDGSPQGWGTWGRRPQPVRPGQTLESARSIHCPSMGLLRRPTPGEIVEGGRFSRPCGPGAHSRASQKTSLRLHRHFCISTGAIPTPAQLATITRASGPRVTEGGIRSPAAAAIDRPRQRLEQRCDTRAVPDNRPPARRSRQSIRRAQFRGPSQMRV